MRTIITTLWLGFAVFLLVPIGITYATGGSYDEVIPTIEIEAETKIDRITGEETHGNRVLLAFTAGDDFGVAVFSHYGDNYRYEEGTMSNGMKHIDVNLDTGWNIYVYEVTADEIRTAHIREGEGLYRVYGIVGGLLIGITVLGVIFWQIAVRRMRKRKEKHVN